MEGGSLTGQGSILLSTWILLLWNDSIPADVR
jgi:hypothetical protein